jgi:hypothetical protein
MESKSSFSRGVLTLIGATPNLIPGESGLWEEPRDLESAQNHNLRRTHLGEGSDSSE